MSSVFFNQFIRSESEYQIKLDPKNDYKTDILIIKWIFLVCLKVPQSNKKNDRHKKAFTRMYEIIIESEREKRTEWKRDYSYSIKMR